MTALATLSDASDLPLWTGRQWLLVLTALTVAGILIAAYCRHRNARPAPSPEAGVGCRPCPTRDCNGHARVWVWQGSLLTKVCAKCADEGWATLGWEWARCHVQGCELPGLHVRHGWRTCDRHQAQEAAP